ncbi:MAG: YtxH domain-containing protein [Anaerolineae bacterium]|nr:YtxH domain-containing protein [Anaerolineae bacterium]
MADRDAGGTFSFVSGLIAGFIVSAPVVAWLAPRSGPETRQAITQQGVVMRRKVVETLRKPVEQVQGQLDQLKGDTVETALAEGKAIAAQHQIDRQEDAEQDTE